MKKLAIILLIATICMASLFAIVTGGIMTTDERREDNSAEGKKKSLFLSAGTFWSDNSVYSQKGFSVSMITEIGFNLTYEDEFTRSRNGSGNVAGHNDVSLSVLAGARYVPSDVTAIILSGGFKLTRIGYYKEIGKLSDFDGWDGLVSICTFGLLGGDPSRKLELLADLRFNFLFFGVGAQVGFPIWQNNTKGFADKMSMSLFVSVGNK